MECTVISIAVPAIVSIIGFILTYNLTVRSFKDELRKEKTSIHLKEMATVPYDILVLFDKLLRIGKNKNATTSMTLEMQSLFSRIYAYGSSDAIRVLSAMQQENYAASPGIVPDTYRQMSFYVILASQIKYDITGITISPAHWFELRLTDFCKLRNEISRANNQIVTHLKLNPGFMMTSSL